MAEINGNQGHRENGIHRLPGLAQGTVQPCHVRIHRVFNRGTKDVTSAASFSALAPQLGDYFKLPKDSVHAAAWKVGAASAPPKPEPGLQQHPWTARKYPFPKRQGPCSHTVLDPEPQKPS